jgi:hypothetical protein
MNDFTRIFREIAYGQIANGFKKEPINEHKQEINKLFKKAFPTEHEEDKVILHAVDSMQYVLAMFLLQLGVSDPRIDLDKDKLTFWINNLGAVLLSDLEKGNQE